VPTNVVFIVVASPFVLTFKVSRPTANHENPQKAERKKSRIPAKKWLMTNQVLNLRFPPKDRQKLTAKNTRQLKFTKSISEFDEDPIISNPRLPDDPSK